MEITCISDTHGKHGMLTKDLPGGDVLIHAGDISNIGGYEEIKAFIKWFDSLNYKYKIFIAGNHDFGLQDNFSLIECIIDESSVYYLENDGVELGGVRFYGTPVQPKFNNWAFNYTTKQQTMYYSLIPENTDVLITHCPPMGILDVVKEGNGLNLGSSALTESVYRVKPKLHVFGHIHSSNGVYCNEDIKFINASVLNEQYYYKYKPIKIELKPCQK